MHEQQVILLVEDNADDEALTLRPMLLWSRLSALIVAGAPAFGVACERRHTAAPTKCVCIERANAVDGQKWASSRSISQSSVCVAPPPPKSLGTPADSNLRSFSAR